MARKQQLSIQDNLENNIDFSEYLEKYNNKIICLEVYSEFCGPSPAMQASVRKVKLDIGGDSLVAAKALADKIDALERFRGKSEPVFLFITNGKLTRALFGANGIQLCDMATEEMEMYAKEVAGETVNRFRCEITELLPEEQVRLDKAENVRLSREEAEDRRVKSLLAARKRRVCERLAAQTRRMNLIMFWPHCHQAHYDLYERWDGIGLQVTNKEEIQITEDMLPEILYMSDIEPNEACLHSLMAGEALIVCLRMYDTDDRDFVALLRKSLYEDLPPIKEDMPLEQQAAQITAYAKYSTISKSKPEIRRMRHEAKLEKKREAREERERLKAEQERLEREAEEERERLKKIKEEQERIAALQGMKAAPQEEEAQPEAEEQPDPDEQVPPPPSAEPAPEDAKDEESEVDEDIDSQITVEDEEYIPPGGLHVPGLYSPPNELARANALALFFPKEIKRMSIDIESEFLPPHVLIQFPVEKRHEIMEAASNFPGEILQVGIFAGTDPETAEHVAYTVKQYDKMIRIPQSNERISLMVSRKRSLPLLTLGTLNPVHVSLNTELGEKECVALFPVGYGDDYEEVESIPEEPDEEILVAEPDLEQQADVKEAEPKVVDEENEDDEEED